jgi:hypothetical protein
MRKCFLLLFSVLLVAGYSLAQEPYSVKGFTLGESTLADSKHTSIIVPIAATLPRHSRRSAPIPATLDN